MKADYMARCLILFYFKHGETIQTNMCGIPEIHKIKHTLFLSSQPENEAAGSGRPSFSSSLVFVPAGVK